MLLDSIFDCESKAENDCPNRTACAASVITSLQEPLDPQNIAEAVNFGWRF